MTLTQKLLSSYQEIGLKSQITETDLQTTWMLGILGMNFNITMTNCSRMQRIIPIENKNLLKRNGGVVSGNDRVA